MVEDRRSWLPPVRNTPGRVAGRRAPQWSSFAWVAGRGVDRRDVRRAELREHLAVHLAGERTQRRGAADDRDARVRAAGERDEPAQDEAFADLVLGAADDDDVPFSHYCCCPPWIATGYRARSGETSAGDAQLPIAVRRTDRGAGGEDTGVPRPYGPSRRLASVPTEAASPR